MILETNVSVSIKLTDLTAVELMFRYINSDPQLSRHDPSTMLTRAIHDIVARAIASRLYNITSETIVTHNDVAVPHGILDSQFEEARDIVNRVIFGK